MKILMIDDDLDMLSAARDYCEIVGIEFLSAENASEGFELAIAHPEVDYIVCDGNLPDFNGPELVQKMKNQNQDLKIIGFSSEPDKNREMIKYGAIASFDKDFDRMLSYLKSEAPKGL